MLDVHANTTNKKDFRNAIIRLIAEQKYNCHLTLTFNDSQLSPEFARNRVKEALNRTDRALLGHNYQKQQHKRIHGIFFLEKLVSNGHIHGACKLDPEFMELAADREKTTGIISMHWQKLCSKGSVDFGKLSNDRNWFNYITKEFWRDEFSDQFFFAEDFFGN